MNYLIVGASSGLGRDLAYALSKKTHDLILISRDIRDLVAIKSDLENRFKTKISTYSVDLASKTSVIAFLDNREIEFSLLDGILFPIGMMSDNDFITGLNSKAEQIVNANCLFYFVASFCTPLTMFLFCFTGLWFKLRIY